MKEACVKEMVRIHILLDDRMRETAFGSAYVTFIFVGIILIS